MDKTNDLVLQTAVYEGLGRVAASPRWFTTDDKLGAAKATPYARYVDVQNLTPVLTLASLMTVIAPFTHLATVKYPRAWLPVLYHRSWRVWDANDLGFQETVAAMSHFELDALADSTADLALDAGKFAVLQEYGRTLAWILCFTQVLDFALTPPLTANRFVVRLLHATEKEQKETKHRLNLFCVQAHNLNEDLEGGDADRLAIRKRLVYELAHLRLLDGEASLAAQAEYDAKHDELLAKSTEQNKQFKNSRFHGAFLHHDHYWFEESFRFIKPF